LKTNPYAPPGSEVADVPRHDRRLVRLSLGCALFAVAAAYVGYCAPISAQGGNAVLAAVLSLAAAACAVLAVRLGSRSSVDRAPGATSEPIAKVR
jgi:hypothetical protein